MNRLAYSATVLKCLRDGRSRRRFWTECHQVLLHVHRCCKQQSAEEQGAGSTPWQQGLLAASARSCLSVVTPVNPGPCQIRVFGYLPAGPARLASQATHSGFGFVNAENVYRVCDQVRGSLLLVAAKDIYSIPRRAAHCTLPWDSPSHCFGAWCLSLRPCARP